MGTQWFPASKEVQDTEVMKQGTGLSFGTTKLNFAVDFLEKEQPSGQSIMMHFSTN
jgi:hypothetical protein